MVQHLIFHCYHALIKGVNIQMRGQERNVGQQLFVLIDLPLSIFSASSLVTPFRAFLQ
jgi:hypothetical protein